MCVRDSFTFTLEIHDHMLILWIGGIYHTFDKIKMFVSGAQDLQIIHHPTLLLVSETACAVL